MKYLKITSQGEIEPAALSLMGASTKRGDSEKIGMFGSGNKFALAYLMRSNLEPTIYSGVTQIEIGVEETEFRGDSFGVITIDGSPTSLTTSMGKDWDCWMAIREIFANALDEGEASISLADEATGDEGYTSFYIAVNDDVSEFHDNLPAYFSQYRESPLLKTDSADVFRSRETGIVYRKGIRVMDVMHKSIFDYDLFNIDITEDRTVKYNWQVHEAIFKAISALDTPQLINEYLSKVSDTQYYENKPYSYANISLMDCSPLWDDMIKGSYFCPSNVSGFLKDSERAMTSFIDHKVYQAMEARFGKDILPPSMRGRGAYNYKVIPSNEYFMTRINKAVGVCKLCGIDVDKYDIHVAEFSNKDILGQADEEDNSILLSDRIMSMGQKQIAITIIEEFIHLSTGAKDETREFQDASIGMCVTLMEQISGIEL